MPGIVHSAAEVAIKGGCVVVESGKVDSKLNDNLALKKISENAGRRSPLHPPPVSSGSGAAYTIISNSETLGQVHSAAIQAETD